MVVAIDGPAGSGKSSVARCVAQKTGFEYINSGNFYRAVTHKALSLNIDPMETDAILETAATIRINLEKGVLFIDSQPIQETELHNDAVDRWVAQHSCIPEIRRIVNRLLKQTSLLKNCVVEGRDITSIVFPDADVRIYIDASVEERARRRFNQGVSSLSYEQIKASIQKRDDIDKNKPFGKLKLSEGVWYLDTSLLTIDQVCDKVLEKIREIELCT